MNMVDDTLQIISDAPTEAVIMKKSASTNSFGKVSVGWHEEGTITIYFEPVSRIAKGYGFDYEVAGLKEKKLYYAFMLPDVDIEINDRLKIDGVEYLVFDVSRFSDHIEAVLVKELRANL